MQALIFKNISFGIIMYFAAVRTFASGRNSRNIAIMKQDDI